VDYFSRYFFTIAYVAAMVVTGCVMSTSDT
jgi:hypothetical protein